MQLRSDLCQAECSSEFHVRAIDNANGTSLKTCRLVRPLGVHLMLYLAAEPDTALAQPT